MTAPAHRTARPGPAGSPTGTARPGPAGSPAGTDRGDAVHRHPARGRPRDASIDARVLAAARELLAERGYDGTTVQAIVERSGVHASAVYRRWPSRVEIIEQAVFPGLSPAAVHPSGELRRDLEQFVRTYAGAMGTPAARAAMPGLLASYQATGRSGTPEAWLTVSARPQFRAILAAAGGHELGPGVADDVFDLLLGAIVARSIVPTVAARNRPVERLVDLVVRLLQPPPHG